jgi:hypothetical protein
MEGMGPYRVIRIRSLRLSEVLQALDLVALDAL